MNYHPLHKSLSRSVSVFNIPVELTAESVLFSYYVSKFYYINIDILRFRTIIDDATARIITLNKNNGYSIGYRIVREAILEGWPPARVRKTLMQVLAHAEW